MLKREAFLLIAIIAACGPSQKFYPSGVGAGPSDGGTSGGDGGDPEPGTDGGTVGAHDSGRPSGDDASSDFDGDVSDIDSGIEFNAPPKCSSGTYWTRGDDSSDLMHPGGKCRTCHVIGGSGGKKTFDIGGTIYVTAHEPDECNGISGASIVITDANGATHTLGVNSVGNFYNADLFGFAAIPKPYKAKVVQGGKVREMITPQTDGDCNNCHSQKGDQLAPGRIILPL